MTRGWLPRGVVAACLTLLAATAGAQGGADSTASDVTFLFQPGMLSADFMSAPAGNPATSGFNLRFATRIGTRSRWLTPVVGASVTPYGTTGASVRNHNGPMLFAGNIFPVVGAGRTHGWLSLELPILLTYSFGGGGVHNQQIYGKDFVAEAAFTLHLGDRVLRSLGGALSRLQLYALFDETLTPNEDPATGKTDRFNPVAYYGVTLPLGGSRSGRR